MRSNGGSYHVDGNDGEQTCDCLFSKFHAKLCQTPRDFGCGQPYPPFTSPWKARFWIEPVMPVMTEVFLALNKFKALLHYPLETKLRETNAVESRKSRLWLISSTLQLHGCYSHSSAETMLSSLYSLELRGNKTLIRHSLNHPTCEFLTQIWNLSLEPLFSPLRNSWSHLRLQCRSSRCVEERRNRCTATGITLTGLISIVLTRVHLSNISYCQLLPVPLGSTKFAGKALHEKQQQPFQHWVEGEDSRLDRPLPKIPMSLMGFPAQRSLTMKKVDLGNFSMIQNSQMYSIDIAFTMIFGCWPPWKNKRAPLATSEMDQLCGLSRNGIHDLSDGIPDVLGPFTQANAPFRWLLIFSLQTPLPCNDHGHPWWLYR